MCSGQEESQNELRQTLLWLVWHFCGWGGERSGPLPKLLKWTLSCTVMCGFSGSDVTVIFLFLFSSPISGFANPFCLKAGLFYMSPDSLRSLARPKWQMFFVPNDGIVPLMQSHLEDMASCVKSTLKAVLMKLMLLDLGWPQVHLRLFSIGSPAGSFLPSFLFKL